MKYKIALNAKGALISFSGILSVQDISKANIDLHKDKRLFRPDSYSIWDFSEANVKMVTKHQMFMESIRDLGIEFELGFHRVGFVTSCQHAMELFDFYISKCLEGGSQWEFVQHTLLRE